MKVVILKQQVLSVLYQYLQTKQDDSSEDHFVIDDDKPILRTEIILVVIFINWIIPYMIIAQWSVDKYIKLRNEKKEEEARTEEQKKENDLQIKQNYRLEALKRTKLTIFLTIIMIIVSPLLLIVVSQYLALKLEGEAYANSHSLKTKKREEKKKPTSWKAGFQGSFYKFKDVLKKKGPVKSKESTEQNKDGVYVDDTHVDDNKKEIEFGFNTTEPIIEITEAPEVDALETPLARNMELPKRNLYKNNVKQNLLSTELSNQTHAFRIKIPEIVSNNKTTSVQSRIDRNPFNREPIDKRKTAINEQDGDDVNEFNQIRLNGNMQEGDQTEPGIALNYKPDVDCLNNEIVKKIEVATNPIMTKIESKLTMITHGMLPEISEISADFSGKLSIKTSKAQGQPTEENPLDTTKKSQFMEKPQFTQIDENAVYQMKHRTNSEKHIVTSIKDKRRHGSIC